MARHAENKPLICHAERLPMYIPAHFNVPDPDTLHQLMAQHPLGTLFTHGTSGMLANHLPFLLDPAQGEHGTLHCHVARNNPVWQDIADGDEVLVVFRAGDAYISPTWYPSKQAAHRQVPSWNYSAAHAYGRVTLRDEPRYVRGLVARLTRQHEAAQPEPWKISDAPADFIEAMINNIVGMEIEITRLLGKAKLSQNKEVADIEGAGNALKAKGEHQVGDAMLACAAAKS